MANQAEKLCQLYDSLSLDEVISYFEEYEFPQSTPKQIRTIGTETERLHDGGIERVLSVLLGLWTKMGYRVVVFTTEEPSERDYDYPSEVKRIVVPGFDNMKERMKTLEEHIVEEKIDIWIANSWSYENLIWELGLVKSLEIPFLNYMHGHFGWMYSGALDYGLKCTRVFRLCDTLLSLSDNDAEFYRLNGCKVTRIENPISEELKSNADVSSCENNNILWIGRFVKGKRFQDAITVAEKLKQNGVDFKLDVVGTGPLEKKIRKVVKKKQLEDVIVFHGYQENVKPFFLNAGLMLMTSETESYSLVLLESKAYGIPAVMYNLPYLSMVRKHKGMLTSKLRDTDEMFKKTKELLENKTCRKELGREAKDSFDEMSAFDMEDLWKDIFSKDFNEQRSVITENVEVFDTLFGTIGSSVNDNYLGSKNYRLGELLLRIPRKILKR